MKLKRLQNTLIDGGYLFIYKYCKGIEELAIDDKTDNIMLHYNKDTDMLIILTFINGVATTKNFYKFSDSIYNKIREFFINQKEIKDFKKIIDNLYKK
jgi:hypothetical protein